MLYYLAQYRELFSAFNLFQYITFRAGGAFLTSLGMGLWWGPRFIDFLKKLKMGQSIREYGPQTHLKKAGTPTMGGVMIVGAILFATFLWARPDNRFVLLVAATMLYMALLGFFDDYRKWLLKHPAGGLSRLFKLGAQLLLALGVGAYLYRWPPNDLFAHDLMVPFVKNLPIPLGGAALLLAVLVIVGSSNAVTLTDGLDGLASGTLMVSALSFAIFAYLAGHARLSHYLRIVPVPGAGDLTVLLAAVGGACLGFLWFNAHPAEIFMGDTGSLPLGGALGVVALCLQQELILVVTGGIFVAEALSVLLQIGSIRLLNGRRVFRMAPLHHHFEMGGLAETKVTIRFWIVAVVLALLAMTSLKIR